MSHGFFTVAFIYPLPFCLFLSRVSQRVMRHMLVPVNVGRFSVPFLFISVLLWSTSLAPVNLSTLCLCPPLPASPPYS